MNEDTLYGRINSQWTGYAQRLHMPRITGISDYHLTTPRGLSIYAEVKIIVGSGDQLKSTVTPKQERFLLKAKSRGAGSLVIAGYERGAWLVIPPYEGIAKAKYIRDIPVTVLVPKLQGVGVIEMMEEYAFANDIRELESGSRGYGESASGSR